VDLFWFHVEPHERRDEVRCGPPRRPRRAPATGWALIQMDCLTMDPFWLINTRIESYMGLRVLKGTGRPAIAVSGRVNSDTFDLRDGNVGAVGSNGVTVRWDVGDPEPAQLQINGNCCSRRDTHGKDGALAHTRRRGRRGERTGLGAALKWRNSARLRSTWNTDGDPLRVWSSRVRRAHRRPPIPTFCGPSGWLRPAAAASLCPRGSR
jgi:hypothetical protein